MLSTVRQLPKVRVLLNRRETRKYDITLSQSFRQSRSGNGAVTVEDRTRGVVPRGCRRRLRMGRNARPERIFRQNNTIQYANEANPSPFSPFDEQVPPTCDSIHVLESHTRRLEIGGREISGCRCCTFNTLFTE